MLELKAFRLRLYPTSEQFSLMDRIAGCCRVVYNTGLEQRRWFARPGRNITYASQAGELQEFKQEFPWLTEAPYHCLQQSLVDLESAYKNFWAGRAGAPQRKKRGENDSFRFPDPTQVMLEGNLHVADNKRTRSLKNATLKLPKLGVVQCVLHRSIANGATVKSVTVSRDGLHWYASVMIEQTIQEPVRRQHEPVVGIDLGIAQPVVLSTGEKFTLPKAKKGDLDHQAKLQQSISRKQKGSRNRYKAIKKLAAFKSHQARVRRDAMEKVTTAIAKNHGVVAMEDLRIKNMTASAKGTVQEPGKNVAQKAGLNRSMLDVSLGAFRVRLGQKMAIGGGIQLLVPAHHTSQRCPKCGHVSPSNRVERDSFACTCCGHVADADVNAAINIKDRALGLWGNADKVEIAASLDLLLKQQAKPKRSFKKKTTGGLPVSACKVCGIRHGQTRKRVAATQPSKVKANLTRSSVL